MNEYVLPEYLETRFTCPHCNALAGIRWSEVFITTNDQDDYSFTFNGNLSYSNIVGISTCKACSEYHIWLDEKMIWPIIKGIPNPNSDMPEEVKKIYNEARDVFPYSAKAAAALLRLAVQKLCAELGGTGKKIDDDIKYLVQQGLSVKIQRALDAIRVIGNNAVHPGTIDLNDNPEMAALLFSFINIITNDMITQPKSIELLYSQLPLGALEAIKRRDGSNT